MYCANCKYPVVLLAAWAAGTATASTVQGGDMFANMSLEELSDVKVISVSKREERLGDAPASIFVITAEDLRRSGARSLPEALRLAPNLHVAVSTAGGYVVTARGFSGNGTNKQLVMIDGRSIYSPLFSGVFWDAQYLPMESIERIEVISGPGGTLWGTNAMNGVINIITKAAAATLGTSLDARWGQQQSGATVSHGAPAEDGAWRAYAMDYAMPSAERLSGEKLGDAWHYAQAGFRRDWQRGADSITLQGDAYHSGKGQLPSRDVPRPQIARLNGANLMAHWIHQLMGGASWNLLFYYDRTHRDHTGSFLEDLDVLDAQGIYNFAPQGRHELVLGGEYRFARDRVANKTGVGFIPAHTSLRWGSLFAQDTISLSGQLKLTAGLRLERNGYTGNEFLPNLRLAWKPDADTMWWTSLTRTVRAPTRLDRDIYISQSGAVLRGGADFQAEVAKVAELGLRQQLGNRANYSVTVYRARYDRLRTVTELKPRVLFTIENNLEGDTRGIEAWGNLQLSEAWRLGAGFTAMHEEFRMKPGVPEFNNSTRENYDPMHTVRIRSSLALGEGRDLDVTLRRVSPLRYTDLPSYTALDVNLNWRLRPRLDLTLGASNALDRDHDETRGSQAASPRAAVGRGAYVRLISRF
ncbi:TonB-dependent receptor plug domain-containing protein [Pseudoduganella sp. OTU4001]|uniref:TonB-dependent receptor plug domain-containing protein n=1 Tax=Pseudoduganella sp. OTU4001 TaxID=3043854 RepID=UPI00313AEC12